MFNLERYFAPTLFYPPVSRQYIGIAGGIVAAILLVGLYLALVQSPIDYQQGEATRIMYVHVPAAWMSLAIYSFMAALAITFLAGKVPMAMVMAHAAAPLGAAFTAVTLITGMLWGKPMWGAWWVWDARLTSVLLLFFLYLGYIVLAEAHLHEQESYTSCALLLLVGAANIPIIKFSVEWWNTLHQPASLMRKGGISIDASMQWPLFTMFAGYMALFLLLFYARLAVKVANIRRVRKAKPKASK